MSHHPLKKQMPRTPVTSSTPVTSTAPTATPFRASYWYVSALLTLSAAAALLVLNAQAQTAEPVAPVSAAPQTATPTPANAPKYAAKDIERAFSYIDANRDNKITREEATGFRGVAKHFDEADSNKDGMLSREEFEHALNVSKPQ